MHFPLVSSTRLLQLRVDVNQPWPLHGRIAGARLAVGEKVTAYAYHLLENDWQTELTICKSQRHFVSAAAAILKGVSLGLNLTQSRCGCTVVCQSFGRTAMFCKNWEIVGSLSCDTWLSLSIAKVRNKRK